jgi:hypothetical protein
VISVGENQLAWQTGVTGPTSSHITHPHIPLTIGLYMTWIGSQDKYFYLGTFCLCADGFYSFGCLVVEKVKVKVSSCSFGITVLITFENHLSNPLPRP